MQELPADITKAIDKMLQKFPPQQRQSAVISALMLVQKRNKGWLTTQAMDLVAEYLRIDRIAVYEVANFYSLFDLKPVGRHKIYVCTNLSCMLRGSEEIVDYIQKKIGVSLNQTTADGKFTLRAAECLAACGGAPMMQVDEAYYENLTPEKIDKILAGVE